MQCLLMYCKKYTNKTNENQHLGKNAQSTNFDLFRNAIDIFLIKGELYGKTKYSICL